MTIDGKPLNANNSLGDLNPLSKYYGYGIRNSFGFDFDPLTNRLWFTDNGPSFGDEINSADFGFNGGWKQVMGFSSLKKSFNESNLVTLGGKAKYHDPQFEWLDTIGITALTFMDSDSLGKEYQNDFFVGDINNGNIYHFEPNLTRTGLSLKGSLSDKIANNLQESDQIIFARGLGGITDMKVSPDGVLYVVSSLGKIYSILPKNVANGSVVFNN
jgi:glucose/arabinose dehydrogenase